MANVPEIRVEFDPTGSPSTASPEWRDLSTYARLTDGISWSSGRQDETASIQAGVMSVNLNNDGGVFTPGSGECVTAWGVDLRIRVPIRLRARYGGGSSAYGSGLYGVGSYSPTISGNLLSAEDASFESGTVGTWTAGGTVPPTLSNSTAHPQVGTKGLLITWGTGGTLPQAGVVVTGLVIGRYYTASAYVYVPTGSPDPLLAIAGGTLGASTATKDALERISVTWQAAAASETLQVWPATSPTAGQTCYVDAVQVDEGTTVGDFTTSPPPVYDVWSGFVDSWDGGWTGGRRPITQVRASDRWAQLNRRGLRTLVAQEILADGPTGYWTLGDSEQATAAGNSAVNPFSRCTPVATQRGTGGSLTFGSTLAPGAGDGTAATFAPSSTTNGIYLSGAVTGLALCTPEGLSTGSSTFEAFFNTAATTTVQVIAALLSTSYWPNYNFALETTAAGKVLGRFTATDGTTTTLTSGTSYTADFWNHVAVTVTGGVATLYLNGVSQGSTGTLLSFPAGNLAGPVCIGGTSASNLFTGSIAHVAYHGQALSSARIAAHYQAGGNAAGNEVSSARFTRLCSTFGLAAAHYAAAETGLTTMGPQPTQGKSAAAALSDVAEAEAGLVFVDSDGIVTFHSRSHRYNTTSSFTLLGSDVEPGLVFTTDDQKLINDATITRYGGAVVRSTNQDSIDQYDVYDVSRSVYASDDTFSETLAQYLVNTYGTPAARSSAVEVDLYSKAATAPVTSILAATIGTRFTINALPDSSSSPSTSVDLFVEGVSGSVNDREWKWRANTSPVNASAVWSLDSTSYSQLDTTTILAF